MRKSSALTVSYADGHVNLRTTGESNKISRYAPKFNNVRTPCATNSFWGEKYGSVPSKGSD